MGNIFIICPILLVFPEDYSAQLTVLSSKDISIIRYCSHIGKKRNTAADAAAAAKSLQSCPTLCDPLDGSPQTEAHQATVLGILQARTPEWVAISLSSA